MWRPDIRDNTPEGAETRANLVRVADVEQRKSNEMVGAELGYRYVSSPLIAAEGGQRTDKAVEMVADEGPEHNFIDYVPSTFPGARLPHVWLEDGTAVQDRVGYGHGYTLLRFAGDREVAALGRAFAAYGALYGVLDLPDQRARDIYGYDLVLVRPDLHVVWRGNALPDDPAGLAALAAGH